MAVSPSAGATIAIASGIPATLDAIGYVMLAYTPIGEVTSIGEFGREFEKAGHKALAARGTTKKKGGYDDGAIQLNMGLDEADPGQLMIQAARESDADFFVRVERLDGSCYYCPVVVFSYRRVLGERGGITGATALLEITSISNPAVIRVPSDAAKADFTNPDQSGVVAVIIL